MAKLTLEEKERRKEERRQKKWNEAHMMVNGIDHKLCTYCDGWFPSTEEYFYKNKANSIDGLQPYCKECNKNKVMLWEKENPEKLKINRKRTNENRKEKLYEYGRISQERGAKRDWRRRNKGKLKEYYIYRKQHKEHEITSSEWNVCKEYFSNECAYCGLSLEEHERKYNQDLHKEHVNHNGSNKLDNCVPSCKICNSSKKDSEFLEWYNEDNPNFNVNKLNRIIKWIDGDYQLYIEPSKPKRKHTKRHKKWFQ